MIKWSAGALVLLWLLLPVRLPRPSSGPSSAECLTLSDVAPDPQRPNLVAAFEGCIAMNPTDADLSADLGHLYESSGRSTDAEGAYRRALQADPGYVDLRIRLAHLLLNRGDLAGAREQAEAARRVQPNRQAVLDLLDETGPQNSQNGVGRGFRPDPVGENPSRPRFEGGVSDGQ